MGASNGHEAVVGLLLERGADATVRSVSEEKSLLHWAALGGNEAVVRMLQMNGADVGEALGMAAARGHEAAVRLLLRANADVDVLELQLRGPATDPIDTLRILRILYGSFEAPTNPLIL